VHGNTELTEGCPEGECTGRTEDDNFQEVERRKRDLSQTAKKSAKPVPTSAAIRLPPKAVLICNFFAPLRTTDMDIKTNEAENTLPEQDVPRKPDRVPPIMTLTTNLIRLQSDLKDHVKGEYEFRNTRN
jgi:hypothetical protein